MSFWWARRRAVLVFSVAIFLSCGFLASTVGVEWVASLELPSVVVYTTWPGVAPGLVERDVTLPLEQALVSIPGCERLESSSSLGLSRIQVSVARERELSRWVAEASERLSFLSRSAQWPREAIPRLSVQEPEILRDESGFMVLQLVGGMDSVALRRLAEGRLSPRLSQIDGVATVQVVGGDDPEIQIRLPRHADVDLGPRLAWIFRERSYGDLRSLDRATPLFRRPMSRLADLEAMIVEARGRNTIRLAELGWVRRGTAPPRSISRVDGQPVVTLVLDRAPGSHLLNTAQRVRTVVETLRSELPGSVDLQIADDRSEQVLEELWDLAWRSGLGLALLILVLMVMLRRDIRAVGVVLFAVALSLSVALALLKPFGLTLNLLTLAGLALLVGLLVDNAVVVVERIQVELGSGASGGHVAACRRALRATWLPLLGGTVSTLAVFLPMVYLSGELRGLFGPFAILAALTLGFSLLTSFLLVPCWALRARRRRKTRRSGVVGFLAILRLGTRHPKATFGLLLLAIGLPTPLLPRYLDEPPGGFETVEDQRFAERYNATLGSEWVPSFRDWLDPILGGVTRPFLEKVELGRRWSFDRRPQVTVWLRLPSGSGIARADEQMRPFEEEALRSPVVHRTITQIQGESAFLRILFDPGSAETDEPYLLRERLISQALQVAGVEIAISGLVPRGFYTGLGAVTGFVIHAYGPSYEDLEQVASTFARRLESNFRVAEVDIDAASRGQRSVRDVVRLRWSTEAVAETGIGVRRLVSHLRPRLWSEAPSFYADFEGKPRMPVRLITEEARGLDLHRLKREPLLWVDGRQLRLRDHARISLEREPPAIDRLNQQYRRTIRVYWRGPTDMGEDLLDREIRASRLPAGYRLERSTPTFFTGEVQAEFFGLILGTLGLVFLVLAAVLESWRLAAVVMLSVPLAWVGIAPAFLLTGQNFAEGAFLGVVLTVGIAVNDSILLAHRYRLLRHRRPASSVDRLALLAVRQRLRPMWTTTCTSVVGMLPFLLLPEAGSFWIGLAVTVVGGLFVSTLLAPLATVSLWSWAARRR